MRPHRFVIVLSALTFGLLLGSVPTATAASASYCGITWGSLSKSSPELVPGPLVNARVGRHDCWDRLVVDLGTKPAPGYYVQYTDGFSQPGSGTPVPVAGGAVLTVHVLAPSYDVNGNSTVPWTDRTHIVTPQQFRAGGFRTFRDLAYGGSFEGETSLGLGVRARLPFRVLKLDGPGGGSRLVIDVAHRW